MLWTDSTTVAPSAPPSDDGAYTLTVSTSPAFLGTLEIDQSTGVVTIGDAHPSALYVVTVTATDDCAGITVRSFKLIVRAQGAPTTTALSASPSSGSTYGQSGWLTATVSAQNRTPVGAVVFKDGGAVIGEAILLRGQATLSTRTLGAGVHSFQAFYRRTAWHEPSESVVLPYTIAKAATLLFSVTSSANACTVSQPVALKAKVKPAVPGSGAPTGTVTFSEGGVELGSAPLVSGIASAPITFDSVGTHYVHAMYGGDANFSDATAGYTQRAGHATSTSLQSSPAGSAPAGSYVTFTATVTCPGCGGTVPSGTATFYDGSRPMARIPVHNGTASWRTRSLRAGPHAITASYASSGLAGPSTSGDLAFTVTP